MKPASNPISIKKILSCFAAIICFACLPAMGICQSLGMDDDNRDGSSTNLLFLAGGIILAVIVIASQRKAAEEKAT